MELGCAMILTIAPRLMKTREEYADSKNRTTSTREAKEGCAGVAG